ncbi:MAG: AAA family ATPase [Synergistaceae bacterium]|nr:AAA family ATPase [Synergistaceae bacterium]
MQILKAESLTTDKITALIYAPPGMGKTTLLGGLPGKTLIIDIDRGTSVLSGNPNVDIVRLSDDLHEMNEILSELKSKCEYQNVALDSLSELQQGMLAYLGRIGKNNGVPDMQAYGRVDIRIIDWCRQFRALPCNVFFTAWEIQKEIVLPSGEKTLQARPLIRDKIVDNICGLCDLVGQIVMSDNERYILLEGSTNVVAKDMLFKRKFCKFEEVINV